MLVGVGYRRELAAWIEEAPGAVNCLEVTAEHFFTRDQNVLPGLRERFTLSVHGLGLSLGTPGPLDAERLACFARVVRLADPAWISEHVAFTRTAELDLGHLNPLPQTRATVKTVAEHARQVADVCGKPLLLENIAAHLTLPGDLPEPEFLTEICLEAGCGLLLDITNLLVNSRNHQFDPSEWFHQLDPRLIKQLHIVGYEFNGDHLSDSHSAPIQEELIALAAEVVRYARPEAIILERDANFPDSEGLAAEIRKLEQIRTSSRPSDGVGTPPQ